jgi:hypothetical protein
MKTVSPGPGIWSELQLLVSFQLPPPVLTQVIEPAWLGRAAAARRIEVEIPRWRCFIIMLFWGLWTKDRDPFFRRPR